MTGVAIINGTNSLQTFGILLSDKGYDGLLSMPKIRGELTQSWHEQHGVEVDLSDIKYEAKEFNIEFITASKNADINEFLNHISKTAVSTWTFPDLEITRQLRLVGGVEHKGDFKQLTSFVIRFSEDEPMLYYERTEPVAGEFPNQGWKVNAEDLSSYSVAVLEGSDADILKLPAVKENLKFKYNEKSGTFYDSQFLSFKEKPVKIKLLAGAETPVILQKNLHALFYDITQPHINTLEWEKGLESFYFYLQEFAVTSVIEGSKVWAELSLTFNFTSYEQKKYIYFGKQGGYLFASDTSNQPNEGMIIFEKVNPSAILNDKIDMNANYLDISTLGTISIELNTDKTIQLTASNGTLKLTT